MCICVCKIKYKNNDIKIRQEDQGNQYVIKTFLSSYLLDFCKNKNFNKAYINV